MRDVCTDAWGDACMRDVCTDAWVHACMRDICTDTCMRDVCTHGWGDASSLHTPLPHWWNKVYIGEIKSIFLGGIYVILENI